jgi:four helix bundle protein
LARAVHYRLRMNEKAAALQERTRKFAAAVIRFCGALPTTGAARQISQQVIDSANSTDSNYRAACRARSRSEFIAKIGIVIKETDESKGWLLLLVESEIVSTSDAQALVNEADELTAIFVRSRQTAEKAKFQQEQINRQLNPKSRPR